MSRFATSMLKMICLTVALGAAMGSTARAADLDFDGKRNPDGQGFAAFGKVVSGMEFVRQIQQLPETGQMLEKTVKIINIEKVINRKT